MDEIKQAIKDYRIRCDIAVSERDDGFYTQAEYEKSIIWEENELLALIASYTPKRFKVLITNGGCTPIENVDHAHLEDVVFEDGHMVSAVLVAETLKEAEPEGKPNE